MNANQRLRLELELSKAEKELLVQAVQEARQKARSGNLPPSQKSLRIGALMTLESLIEDSWQSEVSTFEAFEGAK